MDASTVNKGRIISLFFLFFIFSVKISSAANLPVIDNVQTITSNTVEKYSKFEASFNITTLAANVYFPYEENPPLGIPPKIGINADGFFLSPGETDWNKAKTVPCFYYQPVEERGSGTNIGLVPIGRADWRCRFTPEIVGKWSYKIKVIDAGGTTESSIYQFDCIPSLNKGFIRISQTDPRFFEYSNGMPFITPLVNIEEGNPFDSLEKIRINTAKMGTSGVRFVRWFPTGEGANYYVIPFGDRINMSWRFGTAGITISDADSTNNKKFSFYPYFYTAQNVPAVPGARYKITFRAKVEGEQVLRISVANRNDWQLDICSAVSTYHQSIGNICSQKSGDWQDYSFEFTNLNKDNFDVAIRGLYVSSDAPAPFNTYKSGKIRISSVVLQRDETGQSGWGANLLTRSDPDTYSYVDQIASARLDEIMQLSEQFGVYHKLTLFHKNDFVLNSFLPDGTVGNRNSPNNFYSLLGQASRWYQRAYTRYFVARWSYSTALHSLELGNENDLSTVSYNAGFDLAEYVHNLSPRHVLMSNSFWGWWVETFWTNNSRGYLMDYSDKHWYANNSGASCDSQGTNCELISNLWQDSAAYERECVLRFNQYRQSFNYNKPIVRGEGGVAQSGTEPQNPLIAQEPTGVYYSKKLWAHIGSLGYSCDGEWYPRLFKSNGTFPNSISNVFSMFASYERFLENEQLSNGNFSQIGTDLAGTEQILSVIDGGIFRAWGVRDSLNGRVLLWIDNANHTWKNVVDNISITPAGGLLTLQQLPAGNYRSEWWNTRDGIITETKDFNVNIDGNLIFRIDNLVSDIAVKFYLRTSDNLTPTQTPSLCTCPAGMLVKSSGNSDCNEIIDLRDLMIWREEKTANIAVNADFNCDGIVDIKDLMLWRENHT